MNSLDKVDLQWVIDNPKLAYMMICQLQSELKSMNNLNSYLQFKLHLNSIDYKESIE